MVPSEPAVHPQNPVCIDSVILSKRIIANGRGMRMADCRLSCLEQYGKWITYIVYFSKSQTKGTNAKLYGYCVVHNVIIAVMMSKKLPSVPKL